MSAGEAKSMLAGVVPISDEEREARLERARQLMRAQQLAAVIMESGSSMFYFTGARWGLSERTFALILPVQGDPVWVCPKFEEDRAHEVIRFGEDIRTWEEDDSPYRLFAEYFQERGMATARVGLEEQMRFFISAGIQGEARGVEFTSAHPVTVGCRSIKSPAEIALMQTANDITVEAYRRVIAGLRLGMSKDDFAREASAAFTALGVGGGIGVNFGEHSALPHGSARPRTLREGDVILMDGGCTVEGYCSDISRTMVFGTPTPRQREHWELEKRAQLAAFAAARPGVTHESIDAAARRVLSEAGLGPGYRLPGLPHRTGHGIGLDGHEWTYLVKGNQALVEPGMCFTNEPTVVIPGEYGIRLEDDMYITEDGVRWFTQPSPAMDQPFA